MTIKTIDEDDHIMTLAEWLECVEDGCFIDDDGFGEAIIWDGISKEYTLLNDGPDFGDAWVYPSEANKIPPEATHINWYNK